MISLVLKRILSGERLEDFPSQDRLCIAHSKGGHMQRETLNLSIRKFLKTVGVSSQREIEQAVDRAISNGEIKPDQTLKA